jgi:spermidine synthase
MMLELVGSRLLAPFLGTSLVIWTSLIGIILAALSAGYAWGGKLADKEPTTRLLSRLVFYAAAWTAFMVGFYYPLLSSIQASGVDLRVGAIIASVILFAVPAVLLGMVSPFAVRLSIENVETSGQTAGRLYALSTAGSIAGTFLAGFVLIPHLGTTRLLILLAVILGINSLLLNSKDFLPWKFTLLMAVVILYGVDLKFREVLATTGFRDFDTLYSRVLVLDGEDPVSKRKARHMLFDPLGIQSRVFLDNTDELAADYLKMFRLAEYALSEPKSFLILGGGAYNFPRHLASTYPDATIEVVELDPGVTKLAREYFGLKEYPNMVIHHEDARTFINREPRKFDCILLDIYGSSPNFPFSMTTTEAFGHVSNMLEDGGIAAMNVLSSDAFDERVYLSSLIKTARQFFPKMRLFRVLDISEGDGISNYVLLAAKREINFIRGDVKQLIRTEIGTEDSNGMILTDDYAPVETMNLVTWKRLQDALKNIRENLGSKQAG